MSALNRDRPKDPVKYLGSHLASPARCATDRVGDRPRPCAGVSVYEYFENFEPELQAALAVCCEEQVVESAEQRLSALLLEQMAAIDLGN